MRHVKWHVRATRFLYAHRTLPQRVLGVVAPRPVLVNLGEFRMFVRLDDWLIGARILLRRSYEKYVSAVMRPFLQPGTVLLDLGANLGYFTLLAALHVGAQGQVIAFEPNPTNCALIRASVARNGFRNVLLYQKAVSERAGTVGLEIQDSNGQILRDAPGSALRVETVALDEFLTNLTRVDIVKMDIEGAEALALQGMRRLLSRFHPILFSEFHPAALRRVSQVEPEGYLDALRALGYHLFVIDRVHGLGAQPASNLDILAALNRSPYEHIDLVAFPQVRPQTYV